MSGITDETGFNIFQVELTQEELAKVISETKAELAYVLSGKYSKTCGRCDYIFGVFFCHFRGEDDSDKDSDDENEDEDMDTAENDANPSDEYNFDDYDNESK